VNAETGSLAVKMAGTAVSAGVAAAPAVSVAAGTGVSEGVVVVEVVVPGAAAVVPVVSVVFVAAGVFAVVVVAGAAVVDGSGVVGTGVPPPASRQDGTYHNNSRENCRDTSHDCSGGGLLCSGLLYPIPPSVASGPPVCYFQRRTVTR
jgi:hypothetical protein